MAPVKIQTRFLLGKSALKRYAKVAVLVDENTRRFCYEKVGKHLPDHTLISIPAGETHKNLDTCRLIWEQLTALELDRHSLLIVLGGGVAGDMGGFCAATFKRGIDFYLIPTTLLAQVDASVGGKLGVDFGPFKNHIGAFKEPVATHIATEFLDTLPKRELRSGFAEVIKHCLIADKKMWDTIRKNPLENQSWLKLVRHSVNIKSKVVRKDPQEKGLRKILNLGHTLGHAVEGALLAAGQPIFHGEAIAAGIIMETRIASRKKFVSLGELSDIQDYVLSVFGKIDLPDDQALIPLIKQDKKNKGNRILTALLKGIGKVIWDVPVSEGEIRDAMNYYRSVQT